MATKTLNTRIQLKYDSYSNWTTNNPVLLSGEIAIAVVPASTGAVVDEPAVLIKVGDGSTAYNSLPFLSGKAADVHSWAKEATKPSYSANEIAGLADYISGEVQDTNTKYDLRQDESDAHVLRLYKKDIGDADFSLVTTITTADTVYDDTAVKGDISDLKNLVGATSVGAQIAAAIEALDLANTYDAKGAAAQALTDAKAYADGKDAAIQAAQADATSALDKIGAVPDDSTVMAEIAKAKAEATYDDTALAGRVTAVEGDIDTLNGEGEGSVKKAVADGIATVVAGADADFDTLKEVADWIKSDTTGAAKMQAQIATLTGGDTVEGSVAKAVKDAKDYADGLDSAMDSRVDALEAAIGEGGSVATQIATEIGKLDATKSSADVEAGKGVQVTVVETDGVLTSVSVSGNYDEAYDAKGAAAAVKTELVGTASDTAASDTIKGAKAYAEDAVTVKTVKVNGVALTPDANKAVDVAVPTGALASKDTVAEADLAADLKDKINGKANTADLAAIATTGNVNDLVQTSGDYIIFNCGSSSAVI